MIVYASCEFLNSLLTVYLTMILFVSFKKYKNYVISIQKKQVSGTAEYITISHLNLRSDLIKYKVTLVTLNYNKTMFENSY